MQNAIHWVNHLAFNPNSSRISFLHRWSSDIPNTWNSRLITANLEGSDLHLLADNDFVSHYTWKDTTNILVWAKMKGLFSWFKPKFIYRFLRGRGTHGFFLINDENLSYNPVGLDLLYSDGHCSYSPDKKWILTDTYPDSSSNRRIILYQLAHKFLLENGKFYSPPEIDGEIRCDLHPRWSRDGRYVCFDSFHTNQRQMYIINLENIIQDSS